MKEFPFYYEVNEFFEDYDTHGIELYTLNSIKIQEEKEES